MITVRRGLLLGLGVAAGHRALEMARQMPRGDDWHRTNYRGRTVSLAGGPALATAATVTAAAGAGAPSLAAAAILAGGTAGAVGWYDDIVGARPDQATAKGFRGHLAALRDGRVTSGMVKVAGVGLAGLAAAALAEAGSPRGRGPLRRIANVALGGGVIAGTANLVNLLDLRPGRAIKAGTLIAAPMIAGPAGGLVAGPVGAAAAVLPADLAEEVMLGDAGANAYGALIGLALTVRCGPLRRAALLAGIAALTAASEKVSFTKVIEATPGLREFDALGRRTVRDEPGVASPTGS
jgi:UDP-N-acetylmuramyl pentapeptide phosphotransferase/UDP-N-acetylglucosamine-1-phosphate transferase